MDYRLSHQGTTKGEDYDRSFDNLPYRKFIWEWEKEVIKTELLRIKKYIENPVILDFACGTGRILTELETYNKNVTGIDVSGSMLEQASRKITSAKLIKSDITKNNTQFEAHQFHIITAFRFFLNAQHSLRKDVLNKFHYYLKSGGIIIFNVHANASNPGVVAAKVILKLKNKFRSDNPIQNSLSIRRIKNLLREHRFRIVRIYHRSTIPIVNEKTTFPIQKFLKSEDFFSKIGVLRYLARNLIFVCEKLET